MGSEQFENNKFTLLLFSLGAPIFWVKQIDCIALNQLNLSNENPFVCSILSTISTQSSKN